MKRAAEYFWRTLRYLVMWSNTVFRVWYIFICNKGSNPLRYLHKFGAILLALYFCIQYLYERDFYFLGSRLKVIPAQRMVTRLLLMGIKVLHCLGNNLLKCRGKGTAASSFWGSSDWSVVCHGSIKTRSMKFGIISQSRRLPKNRLTVLQCYNQQWFVHTSPRLPTILKEFRIWKG